MMFAWPQEKGQDAKIDGDDPDHISWLFNSAEKRAAEFHISGILSFKSCLLLPFLTSS